MPKDTKTEEVLCLLSTAVGGGLAGFLDVKFANKQVAGLPLGAVGGIALAAAGLFAPLPEKVKDYALDGAGGMLAFELGTAVAQYTLKSMLPAASPTTAGMPGMMGIPGVGGSVGALHGGYRGGSSNQAILSQLSQLEALHQRAA